MSKVYALSGARVAYLCCNPGIVEALKEITPPWSISLPAQLAGISALNDVAYYKSMYEQTHLLRNNLQSDLHSLGIVEIIEGVANFLLFYLPEHFPTAEVFIEECRTHHLFLRDVSNMGKALGSGAIRIAVKDEETNRKMISIMRRAIVKNAS
jgi:histidinol-phosphate/aromatic aminotransferase/cobyric acid decarboxylase-like protein